MIIYLCKLLCSDITSEYYIDKISNSVKKKNYVIST